MKGSFTPPHQTELSKGEKLQLLGRPKAQFIQTFVQTWAVALLGERSCTRATIPRKQDCLCIEPEHEDYYNRSL